VKLNPDKNSAALKKELSVAKKIAETNHKTSNDLYHALNTHAPQLSTAAKFAMSKAMVEYQKQYAKLHPEAKKSLNQLHKHIHQSRQGLGDTLQGATGSGLGLIGNIMKSVLDVITTVFKRLFGEGVGRR
jgi:uncharacterized protein YicC (UPF0701 family)